jgi:hypothetical protein
LLTPENDHDIMVLELVGPADVAEMADVGTGVSAAHRQLAVGVLPG